MDDRISDLLGIVRDEICLYRDLVEHARNKTALLVQCRVEAILESNRIEEAICLQLRTLEAKLLCLCDDVCRAFQVSREEFTLMKLAERLEQPLALELTNQIKLWRDIVQQLRFVSIRNRKLTENSLHYSKGMLALISNSSSSYLQSGMFETIPSTKPTFSQSA